MSEVDNKGLPAGRWMAAWRRQETKESPRFVRNVGLSRGFWCRGGVGIAKPRPSCLHARKMAEIQVGVGLITVRRAEGGSPSTWPRKRLGVGVPFTGSARSRRWQAARTKVSAKSNRLSEKRKALGLAKA